MAATASDEAVPRSTGRGVMPRSRSCEAHDSGSSPAMSLRAWSPATAISGTSHAVRTLRSDRALATSSNEGEPSTTPTKASGSALVR